MKLIDTHQHLWNIDQFLYPWCADIPQLNRNFKFDDYRTASEDTGITKTVFVVCHTDETNLLDEARYVQSLPQQVPLISGMVVGGRPELSGSKQYLDEVTKLPLVCGLRRVLHVESDELPQNMLFIKNLQLLAKYNLSFDLCVLARQLPIASELVRTCPDVSFILNHCGSPNIRGKASDRWHAEIKKLSQLPNVTCKISGPVTSANHKHWTVNDLRPWFEHVLECFGWDRVIWGGDWPVCTRSASFMQWVNATLELTEHYSDIDREKLFLRNAERIYQI